MARTSFVHRDVLGIEVFGDGRPFDVGFGYLTSDGSLLEKATGEFIYVHTNDFIEDVVLGDRCPFCFCHASVNAFNDEHVIPEWVLRFTGISNKTINLPNDGLIAYSRYKIRCCVDCNSRMSFLYEDVMSRAIRAGFGATKELFDERPELMYQWLSLLFYKVHLKDLEYRQFPDFRKPSVKIGHSFNWSALHHVFCVARSPLFQYKILPDAIGSIALLRLPNEAGPPAFDYHDHWVTGVIYLRVGEVGIIASLSDAGATSHMLEDTIRDFPETCDAGGARFLLGEFMSAKLHLSEVPKFQSLFGDEFRLILAHRSSVSWNEKKKVLAGLGHAWANPQLFGKYRKDGMSLDDTVERILAGELTFVSGASFIRDETTLDTVKLFDLHREAYSDVDLALRRHAGEDDDPT